MMTQPASVFVIVFTAINVLACLWLMWWTAKAPAPGNGTSQGDSAQPSGTVAKTGHVWDGDLEEYNNPLPRWWLGLFILTVLFGAAYLIFYPGMGNFAGFGKWTSIERYEAQMAQQRARFEQR